MSFLAYFLVVYCVLLPAAFLFRPSAVVYFIIPNCWICLVVASVPAVRMMECFRTPSIGIGSYIWTAFYSIVLVLLLLLDWMVGPDRPAPEDFVNVMFAALVCVPTTMVLILRTVEQKRVARQLTKEALHKTLGFMNSEIDQVLYDRVIRLIVSELNLNRDELHPETRLYHDLGCTGLDAEELLRTFVGEFRIDNSNFVFNRHFGPEAGPSLSELFTWLRSTVSTRSVEETMVPLRVLDLYEAAKTKKFPDLSARAPE